MTDHLRDNRDTQHAQVESAFLRDPTFTAQEKTLYALLITYGPERIFPGQTTLAKCLDVSRPSIVRWLRTLRDRGMIDWINRTGTSNLYSIEGYQNVKPAKAVSPADTPTPIIDDTPPDHGRSTPRIMGDTRSRSNELDPITNAPTGDSFSLHQSNTITTDNSQMSTYDWDLEESPGTEHECPCGYTMVLGDLPKSKCRCPGCQRPVWVHAGNTSRCSPAKNKTKNRSLWVTPSRAFYQFAGITSPTKREVADTARCLQELCELDDGTSHTPEEATAAIGRMEPIPPYNGDQLTTPRQKRFHQPFEAALNSTTEKGGWSGGL